MSTGSYSSKWHARVVGVLGLGYLLNRRSQAQDIQRWNHIACYVEFVYGSPALKLMRSTTPHPLSCRQGAHC